MDTNTVILTRTIQIYIDDVDIDKRNIYAQKIIDWQHIVHLGSNIVINHQYIQEGLKGVLPFREDVKIKLADHNNDVEGILNTSRMNTTYRVLSESFKGKIPADILSTVNNAVTRKFNLDRVAYWKGDKSLCYYKKEIAIPFSGRSLKFKRDTDRNGFKFTLFKIPFRTYYDNGLSESHTLLRRALSGEIKICGSALKLKNRKIFLLLALAIPKQIHALKADIIAEVSLSINHPLTLHIENVNYQIGTKEELLYKRMEIQAARQNLQKAAGYTKGGKGKKKKLKSLQRFKEKERKYIHGLLHQYSRKLINICVESQAGTLLLVNQTQKEELAKADLFILRNWSYFGLVEKIKYKAELAGIQLIVE